MRNKKSSEKITSGLTRKIIININQKTPLNQIYEKIGYKNQYVDQIIDFLLKENILEKVGNEVIKIKDQELKELLQNLDKIENGLQDYIEISDICKKENAYPWGIFVLFEGINNAKKMENYIMEILYSKLHGIHRPVTWKLFRTIFDSGRSSIDYIIESQNMYREEYDNIKPPLMNIFKNNILISNIKNKEYLLFKFKEVKKNGEYQEY